jgi:outer membrane lipoprotein-sorting protein
MSVWSRRPALRWLVPGAAAVLIVGGGAAATAIAASVEPELPPRSAAELLVDLQTAEVEGLSGTVVQTADLGLPAMPETRGHGSADLGSLWSGSNTLRVWYAGPEQARVALLGTLGQTDVIRNGADLWIWESSGNRASHRVLPDGLGDRPRQLQPGMTPQEAADAALAAIDPTTQVSTEGTAQVAGRDAYELVLNPRDQAALVTEVRLAVDAEHGVPLQVQVYGDADDPAFEVRFTQISFKAPDPEQFRFNPPPGATVTEQELLPSMLPGAHEWPDSTVVGEGWTSVLVTRLPGDLDDDRFLGMLRLLPEVSGDWGTGRVLESELVSAMLTDDGLVLVGAVTPERLAEVAGEARAALEGE